MGTRSNGRKEVDKQLIEYLKLKPNNVEQGGEKQEYIERHIKQECIEGAHEKQKDIVRNIKQECIEGANEKHEEVGEKQKYIELKQECIEEVADANDKSSLEDLFDDVEMMAAFEGLDGATTYELSPQEPDIGYGRKLECMEEITPMKTGTSEPKEFDIIECLKQNNQPEKDQSNAESNITVQGIDVTSNKPDVCAATSNLDTTRNNLITIFVPSLDPNPIKNITPESGGIGPIRRRRGGDTTNKPNKTCYRCGKIYTGASLRHQQRCEKPSGREYTIFGCHSSDIQSPFIKELSQQTTYLDSPLATEDKRVMEDLCSLVVNIVKNTCKIKSDCQISAGHVMSYLIGVYLEKKIIIKEQFFSGHLLSNSILSSVYEHSADSTFDAFKFIVGTNIYVINIQQLLYISFQYYISCLWSYIHMNTASETGENVLSAGFTTIQSMFDSRGMMIAQELVDMLRYVVPFIVKAALETYSNNKLFTQQTFENCLNALL